MAFIKGHNIIGGPLAPSRVIPLSVGSPAAADIDYIVESTNMKNGAYTIVHGTLDVARNVTVKHTAVGAADTLGKITVAGTDICGAAISEEITPSSGATVQGTRAFKTIASVTGSGWAINEGNDTVQVGFGEKLGLPVCLSRDTVLNAYLNGVRENTRPTVAVDEADVSKNTVDLSSNLDGSEVIIDYYES